ncbi:MAG: hypothetical protein Q8N94_08280 [Methanoregula sp.]|nr:hypothetical protein [Methanoregula sp.]
METEMSTRPVAKVTGIYRGKSGGFEPLTRNEVRRNPIIYEPDLHPEQGDENRNIDLCNDNLSPMRLHDLRRGTDIPPGVRFWPDWFDILPCEEMHDVDGRRVYPERPGIHTIQIRTGCRKWAQMGRVRNFSPANGGYMSPAFEIRIAESTDVRE